MRRIAAVATLALIAGLAGCSTGEDQQSSGVASAPQSADVAQSAPDPSPTVAALDKTSAGELYLKIVCDTNEASSAFNAAIATANEASNAGQTPDIAPVTSAAAESVARDRKAITVFDDNYYVWPDSVAGNIATFRENLMNELSTFQQVASADSWETIIAIPAANTDATASQEIRYQLGLDADTESSCDGKTGNLDRLAKESAARKAD